MKEIVRETREKIPYRYYSGISMTDSSDTPTSFPEHWHIFTEYLTRQRIQNALALLYQENMSITDVAYLSGFQSLSNFSKVFKNTMHCSPLQYRQKHRQP